MQSVLSVHADDSRVKMTVRKKSYTYNLKFIAVVFIFLSRFVMYIAIKNLKNR